MFLRSSNVTPATTVDNENGVPFSVGWDAASGDLLYMGTALVTLQLAKPRQPAASPWSRVSAGRGITFTLPNATPQPNSAATKPAEGNSWVGVVKRGSAGRGLGCGRGRERVLPPSMLATLLPAAVTPHPKLWAVMHHPLELMPA